jgi:hypothetical protein
MYFNEKFRHMIDRMFVPPCDYDTIRVETRETPDEPILIITLFRNEQVVFFQNYATESSALEEMDGLDSPL